MGSSKHETICGRASSKVFLSSNTEVCLRRKYSGGLFRVFQLVIGKARSVPNGIGVPRLPVKIHEGEQQSGINTAAQQQSKRHIAEQLPFHRLLVEFEQLFLGFAGRLRR